METINYEIIRSGRKTLCLEIREDGSVVVRAPKSCTDEIIERFVRSKYAWLQKHLSKEKTAKKEYSKEEISALKEKALSIIPMRVAYWSEIMGLRPSSVKITSARRRFGSCSGKNSLCFSLYLAERDIFQIDYVVVHELAHIKIKNHSRSFHDLVRKYLPDMDGRIKALKGK